MAICVLAKNKIHVRVSTIKLSKQVVGSPLMTLNLGLVKKNGYPGLMVSPVTSNNPELHIFLMRAAWVYTCKYPEFSFSSIDILKNFTGELGCKPERISPGLVMSVGSFTGGGLHCYQNDGWAGEMENLDDTNKIALINLSWINSVQPSRSCQNQSNCLLFRCEFCDNV